MRALANPTVLFSIIAAVHFGVSTVGWVLATWYATQGKSNLFWWVQWIGSMSHPMILLVWSVMSAIRSAEGKKYSTASLIGIYLVSACLFVFDVTTKHSQIQIGIATKEYWENGGPQHIYLTWWWFNDSWFR